MATNPIVTSNQTSIAQSIPTTGQSQTLAQNAQVVTNTTTVDTVIGSVLTGVSVIPYMRYLAIDFIGYRLRPNRQVWFYFDDKSVDRFIQKPNIIEVNSTQVVADARSGPRRTIAIGGYSARILHVEKSAASGNTRIYVAEFDNANVTFSTGATITVPGTGFTSTVKSYEHFSGEIRPGSSNSTILLSRDANSTVNDYYLGNTITIVNGTDAGQSAEIIG